MPRDHRNLQELHPRAASAGRHRTMAWPRALATLMVVLVLNAIDESGARNVYAQNPADAHGSIISPAVNRPPDANDRMVMQEQQSKKANYEGANVARKKQISDDSARLLKLATDLKTEVDKTSKDTLSLGVIRKADEIEKLARSVKEKMKLTMNAN